MLRSGHSVAQNRPIARGLPVAREADNRAVREAVGSAGTSRHPVGGSPCERIGTAPAFVAKLGVASPSMPARRPRALTPPPRAPERFRGDPFRDRAHPLFSHGTPPRHEAPDTGRPFGQRPPAAKRSTWSIRLLARGGRITTESHSSPPGTAPQGGESRNRRPGHSRRFRPFSQGKSPARFGYSPGSWRGGPAIFLS